MSADDPVQPDFEALERIAQEKAGQRNLLFALIGNMSYCWSNNESMFIYVLQYLIRTDEITATIIFGTLNTTRARIDLVERLAEAKLADKDAATQLRRIIRRFNECTKLRNEFNHSVFKTDSEGAITHTHSMRIQRRNGQLHLGELKPVDQQRIEAMGAAIKKMVKLNREIWQFLPMLRQAMDDTECT
ncbi:hypothetical protein [Pseudovibrio exalbescens]|uniref:Cthe-2314-like HEPN domain-containing protein n=1 Tax=Pseudovibrio exalbescens TaxID=197461 RepID=A0A1U7JJF9_9HYPH|nr:hypothetical protein [Pseudovibrio exalbescens]OKL44791.1 hypothetical protein A3843_06860 [Pseudovibrio exalbescens]